MEASGEGGGVVRELGWAERPSRELLRLSGPITVSMLSYSVMTLVDTLLVGRLGPSALAGVGLGATAAFMLLVFSFGLLRGVKVLVSQALGAGRRSACLPYQGAGIVAALALGLVALVAGQALALALPLVSATAEAGAQAALYLQVRMLGAPLVLVAVAVREGRYGLSDSRSAMVAAVLANAVNVALGVWWLGWLGGGVGAAAAATVVAAGVEAAVLLRAQRPDGYGLDRVRLLHLRALFRVGLPTGVQFVLEMGALSLLAAVLSVLGEREMAAHQVALQVIHFSFLPALAVGEAASVLVGQAVGAGREVLVKVVARRALLVTGAYCGLCSVVMVVAGSPLASAFTDEPGLRGVVVQLLLVAAVFQVFDAANVVARCALRGTGDVRRPALIGIVTAWACTPPLTWLLGVHLGLGAVGGWMALCVEIIVGAVVLWWRLERYGWREAAARMRSSVEAEAQAEAQAAADAGAEVQVEVEADPAPVLAAEPSGA